MKKTDPRFRTNRFRVYLMAALGAAALMIAPTVASAAPFGRGGMGKHRGGKGLGFGKLMRANLNRLAKRFGLSAQQVKQLKQLRKQHKGKMAKVRLKMARINAQMRVHWLADKPNMWKLRKLHLQKLKLKTKMANRRFNLHIQVAKILTPTQRMKLMRARRRGRRFGRRGNRRGKHRFGRRGKFGWRGGTP